MEGEGEGVGEWDRVGAERGNGRDLARGVWEHRYIVNMLFYGFSLLLDILLHFVSVFKEMSNFWWM